MKGKKDKNFQNQKEMKKKIKNDLKKGTNIEDSK